MIQNVKDSVGDELKSKDKQLKIEYMKKENEGSSFHPLKGVKNEQTSGIINASPTHQRPASATPLGYMY